MQTVVVVGTGEPVAGRALEFIAARRGDFMVDGLVDCGDEPRRVAEQVLEFTPLLLGLTDEYAVGAFRHEREDIATDRGLVDWELPEVDVLAGSSAVGEVAGLAADIAVVAWSDAAGLVAAGAALSAGTRSVLVPAELVDSLPGDERVTAVTVDDVADRLAAPIP